MGPNGAGKSTLSAVVMGKPGYEVLDGSVTLDGVDVLALPTWQRAAAGLHLVMQYPTEVPGVAVDDMLARGARQPVARSSTGSTPTCSPRPTRIGFEERLLHRSLNVDLSGGEKKRNETLQLAVLAPKIAILDELDSGLDIDALRACARRIEAATQPIGDGPASACSPSRTTTGCSPSCGPTACTSSSSGRIVAAGGPEVADELETSGYAAFAEDDGDRRRGGRTVRAELARRAVLDRADAGAVRRRPACHRGVPGRSGTARCAGPSSSPTSRRRSRS